MPLSGKRTIIGEAEYAVDEQRTIIGDGGAEYAVDEQRTIIGDGEAEYADDIIRCYI